jgi:prepilin-type N-terminal cleavage/methylation domain-containing protein
MKMRKGFTLIELLVVIAIIAILAAILFPVFARARAKAHTATCQSNLKQLTLAIRMYCDDSDGYGPFTDCPGYRLTWKLRLYQAGLTPHPWYSSLYACKGDNGGNYGMNWYRGGHCLAGAWNDGAPWQIDVGVKEPSLVMLVADSRQELGGRPEHFYDIWADNKLHPAHVMINNLGFCDGHVKGFTPGWMKDQVDHAGDPNYPPGTGAWYWWGLG